VLIYAIVAMVVFAAFCALVVDWGRVQAAKTELQRTADAAARYAATGMNDGTALTKATWIGGQDAADGQAVTFQQSDVELGRWDATNGAFALGATPPNAVRVTARRTVGATFGKLVGINSTTLAVRAVARYNVVGYGLVGLNGITMSGNSTASYWSGSGAYTPSQGNVASNGNIVLGGSSTVNGDTFVGPGKTVSGGTVTGSKTTLATALSFPNGGSGAYGPSNNDDYLIPSWASPGGSNLALNNTQSVTLPGGHYYFSSFSMTGGSSLTFTGPAVIYCYGTFVMGGSTGTNGSQPANLQLVMVPNPYNGNPPGSVTIGGSAGFYGTVYAPESDVTLSGTGDIYGSVLGKTVNMTGSSGIHYDLGLDSGNGTLSLMQ
jgi:Tfp pilus assembly protein PilE